MESFKNLCKCGCKEKVNIGKNFISGHNSRVNPNCHIGHPAWNKGKGKAKSTSQLCKCGCGGMTNLNKIFIQGHNALKGEENPWHGKPSTMFGKTGNKHHNFGRHIHSQEFKNKKSLDMKKNYQNNLWASMMSRSCNIKPNKLEIYLLNILEKLYPSEWKYTGDFSFWINGKNPDFINVNGKKKIIEFFGDYWHRDENPQDRIDIFKTFGYDTLVIWEHELNDLTNLKFRINKFMRGIF